VHEPHGNQNLRKEKHRDQRNNITNTMAIGTLTKKKKKHECQLCQLGPKQKEKHHDWKGLGLLEGTKNK